MADDADRLKVWVKGWIDSEDFKKILRVADYVGRSKGISYFRLSKNKVLSSGLSVDEILSILDDVGAEYDPEIEDVLNDYLRVSRGSAILSFDGERICVKFEQYLGRLYDKLRDLLRYDSEDKVFYTLPYKYHELKTRLHDLGFNVEDLTGFRSDLPLNIDVVFTGELRDYQEDAIKSWLKNDGRGVIALPTGSGKTVIGVASVTKVKQRTLVIAYTKEQLMQWKDAFLKFTNIPEYSIGLYYSKEKRIAPITLATYQTAYKHIAKLAPYFNYIIIDEVHHLPAEKFKHIAVSMPSKYRLGLSATPYREDGKHVVLFPLMGGIVYYKTPQELAEKGYLAKYRIITIKVPLLPAEKKRYEELKKKFRRLAGYVGFDTIVDAARRGDARAIQALRIHSEMRQIIQKSEAKLRRVEEIIRKELAEGSKIIVFAHYVDLAKTLADRVKAYLLTGEMDARERRRVLEEFKRCRSGVLVVTTVGDEGLDIPDANVGILVAGTGSRRQFIQRLGRLLRPGEGKEAKLYEVVAKGTAEEIQSRKRKKINMQDFKDLTNIE